MPDKNGALTAEEKKKIFSWLDQRVTKKSCPVCGHEEWILGDHLIESKAYIGPNILVGGPNYPQFVVVCSNCLYSRHFMAMPLGLLAEEEPEPNAKEKKSGGGDG